MRGGIQHRDVQSCPQCNREFIWAPALGLCPYCDLSDRARQTGTYGDAVPCAGPCCKGRVEK
jgi:hypothetical protein